jgi:hypothetical protein
MPKGDQFPSEKKARPDLTLHKDCPVFQITQHGDLNFCMYFTHPTYIGKTHEMVFSSNRTGISELFKVDIDSGIITQLTENAQVMAMCWGIAPSGRFLIYSGGEKWQFFHRLDLLTLKDEIIGQRPEKYHDWLPSIIDISPDEHHYYAVTITPIIYIPSNLLVGNLNTQTVEPWFSSDEEQGTFYCHHMLCPTNPRLMQINLSFRSDAGKDAAQRMWLLDLDTKSVHPLYKQKKAWWAKFERVGHEAWLPDGQHMCFVVRRDKVKICSIKDNFGEEHAWIAGQGPNYWHVSSHPSGKYLIADTMWDDTGIWLTELVINSHGRKFNLCLTKSEWQQISQSLTSIPEGYRNFFQGHPHPGCSPDGEIIHFSAYNANEKAAHLFVVKPPKDPFQ